MSNRFAATGILLMIALLLSGAAGAVEPPAGLTCPARASGSSTPSVSLLPPWIEVQVTPCGNGCPGIGQGTSPSCTGKMVGDSCGTGGTCLLLLTPSCPRSAGQCSCVTR
jgi:hypothetical protein